MPQEQTFRSANYYEREIDISTPTQTGPVGVPAGVIGTAKKGPAFVPVTVANFDGDFQRVFGSLDTKSPATYLSKEFLKHRNALTFLRVLGAGANENDGDIATTLSTGRVKNAGFKLEGSSAPDDSRGRHNGAVQFITAKHDLQTNEALGFPMFTDNNSYSGNEAHLVRGMVLLASGARMCVLDGNESAVGVFSSTQPDDAATLEGGKFKLVISSTLGNSFSFADGASGVKIFTASLNPTASDYYAKVLNTDPDRFVTEQHLLYADFAVDDEVASATHVGMMSGSLFTSKNSGETSTEMRKAFGAFDTRYKAPISPKFISQPFGTTEYDLFHFEAIDDGEYANTLTKISISNLKASLDDSNQYGTFTVEVRSFNDTDLNPIILERFTNCSLDPNSENYVAKLIGDRKVRFNFDATATSERRIVTSGKYENKSLYVRIIMNDQVERSLIPATSLPFGFRGIELIKTNDSLNDTALPAAASRLGGVLGVSEHSGLSGSVLPPIPFRYKVTRGPIDGTTFDGAPGPTEVTAQQYYWGVKFERNTLPLNNNLTAEQNPLISAYTKFLGIKELDVLVTGSGADTLNNNKFSLANVVLSNTSLNDLTSSVATHMREAAYIRNAAHEKSSFTVPSNIGNRITFATILSKDSAANFNRFSPYAKFTTFLYGGYNGLNILDRNARRMNDKSTSFDSGGAATTSYISPGLLTNQNGAGQSNSNVVSYKTAIDVMTDPLVVNTNLLFIPGIRESFLTDYAMERMRTYGYGFYVFDIPKYDDQNTRLFDDSTTPTDPDKTRAALDARAIDNGYCTSYYPDVVIDDPENKRRLKVPASVAAAGAIAFNDKISYPWFAPAGFNRAALDFVKNVEVRLSSNERDALSDSRINPIAVFPRLGFVIWGQKTMLVGTSTLNRVNVRRMLLEVKRIVSEIAKFSVFEQNTPEVRNKFVSAATTRLAVIQAQSGIQKSKVVMDETNNTQEDIELNRLRGKVIVTPTRTIESIAIDFIVANSGVTFL